MVEQDGLLGTGTGYAALKERLRKKPIDDLWHEVDLLFEQEQFTGEQVNPNLVAAYMEVIEELAPVEIAQEDVEQSRIIFEQNHPELFWKGVPTSDKADTSAVHTCNNHRPTRRIVRRRKRAVLLAAIVIVIFALGSMAVAANWSQIKVTWESEVLLIGTYNSGATELPPEVVSEYRSLAEALDAYDMSGNDPKWIPSGFSITDVETSDYNEQTTVFAVYGNGSGKEIIIRIVRAKARDTPDAGYERSDSGESVYTTHGVNFQLTDNIEQARCTWQIESENIYASITGDISIRQLKHMINSIFEE